MALEQELQAYKSHVREWAEREGQYVLIHGSEVVDFLSAYDDALKAGYERFGLEPFLVKQIHVLEQTHLISRLYSPRVITEGH